MDNILTIAALRREKGWTLADLAERLGLRSSSRGHVNAIERGAACTVKIALTIEALSDGRIPAASLCEDVALVERARGIGVDHVDPGSAVRPSSETGNDAPVSAQPQEQAA